MEVTMFARFGWTEFEPDGLDRAATMYRTTIVPQLAGVDGFLGTFACVDRSTGRFMAVTLWRDFDAMMDHERESAARLIAQAIEATGAPTPTVDRYEIVLWNVDANKL
jgi:hypothetical protein